MLAPVHHILPLTTILRERVLPINGKVNARLNQKVSSSDVVAEANRAREHVLLDVGRALDLSPNAADKLIRCKVGDRVAAGAVIATGKGMIPKTVTVPRDGKVVVTGGGQVLIEIGESRMELRAGIPGECRASHSRPRRGDSNCGRIGAGGMGQRTRGHGDIDQSG